MSGDQLNLDAIEDHAHKTADQGSGSDPHTVLALVAEVRRLRADNEMGRINLAHYRDLHNEWVGQNERLRAALHEARVTIQASVGHYKPPPGYDSEPPS